MKITNEKDNGGVFHINGGLGVFSQNLKPQGAK